MTRRLACFILILSACAARGPSPQVTAELGKADALVREGCYDCLKEALDIYGRHLNYPQRRSARLYQGYFDAALLIAIRTKELGIVLVQSKTQQPLELPLLADVDEALTDYLRHARPACAAREIFLRHLRPIAPFAYGNSHWAVMARALRTAGIADAQPRRGFHLLRHSLATHLLGDGVALDVISDVLGHRSVDTTGRYTQMDLAGLRSVALSEEEVRR